MSFRRSEDSGVTSSRWRLANRGILVECGIPTEVANSDRRWIYLLLHGYDPVSGWKVSWITPQQASRLLALLEPEFPPDNSYDLMRCLRQRIGISSNEE